MIGPFRRRKALRGGIATVGLMAVAAIWIGAGIFYGLPQELDPDERIFAGGAGRMLADRSLDPGWYGAPAQFLMYVLALVFGAVAAIGVLTGTIAGLSAVPQAFLDDVTPFFAAGRAVSTLSVVLCIPLILAIVRRMGVGGVWPWIAAAAFAVSPLVVQYGALIRMDLPQVLFNLATLLLCLHALDAPEPWRARRALIAAGLCVGLAVTNKFTGVIGALPVIATAATLALRGQSHPGRALTSLVLAGVAALVAAFLTGPYLFLNMDGMLAQVAIENRAAHLSQTSGGFGAALVFYLGTALPGDGIGPVATLLAVIGTLAMLAHARARLIAIYFIGYLVFIASLNLTWTRWALPLVPAGLMAAVWLLARLETMLPAGRAVSALRVVAAAVLIGPLAVTSGGETLARLQDRDTRVAALDWIETTVPPGTTLLIETYSPSPSSAVYDLRVVDRDGGLASWSDISDKLRPNGFYGNIGQWQQSPEALAATLDAAGVDYLVLSDWRMRYADERDLHSREVALYDDLVARYPTVATFMPHAGALPRLGPNLRVLAVDPTPPGQP